MDAKNHSLFQATSYFSNNGTSQNQTTPKLLLRTYRPTDFDNVRQLYIETLFALVPEGVRRKLRSITTWVIWLIGYTLLLKLVPIYMTRLAFLENNNTWLSSLLKVVLTFGWAVIGFSALFIVTERFEMTEKVHQGLVNDLKDPESVYLQYEPLDDDNNYSKMYGWKSGSTYDSEDNNDDSNDNSNNNGSKVDEHIPGHFWVLLADGQVCGMMGLAPASKQPLLDSRPLILSTSKQIIQSFGQYCGLSLFKTSRSSSTRRPVIIPSRPQHTATIVRWAVAIDNQQCGLSSLLIHRAMTWAKENGLIDIYATTNEVEIAAEQILNKRHGFTLVKKQKMGWFGRYECLWVCHVDDWVEKNKNHVKSRSNNN